MPKMKGKVLGKLTELVITEEQRNKLLEYTHGQGGHQDLCARVHSSVREKDGRLIARVYDVDMEKIRKVVGRPDTGGWQGLFREIMGENK